MKKKWIGKKEFKNGKKMKNIEKRNTRKKGENPYFRLRMRTPEGTPYG